MGFGVISAMLALGVLVFILLHVWFRRACAVANEAFQRGEGDE